jgi:hypothetical protein
MENNNVSESEKLHEQLNESANKIDHYQKDIEEIKNSNKIIVNRDTAIKKSILELEIEEVNFIEVFSKLYHQSIKDNYFWQYCNSEVYKNYFNENFNQYKKEFPECSLTDFIQNEINSLHENIVDYNGKMFYTYKFSYAIFSKIDLRFINKKIEKNLDYTQNRKIEFLESKLKPDQATSKPEQPEPEIYLDYSNNPRNEKIVFLHELGILDYLQEKMNNESVYFSPNKLAEIISTFTGIEQKTAQSYLNPIFSIYAKQKNNPLNSKTLKRVKNKLKDIGFNTTKTT